MKRNQSLYICIARIYTRLYTEEIGKTKHNNIAVCIGVHWCALCVGLALCLAFFQGLGYIHKCLKEIKIMLQDRFILSS
jgi:hypothetical protein